MTDVLGDNKAADGASSPAADLSRPEVTQKYHAASDVTNAALQFVCEHCVEGAEIFELCAKTDEFIESKMANMYNKKVDGEKPKKGVAFPTCISVNEICGHFSPLKGESRPLRKGDLCKIDLGGHVDGFIAVASHSIVVAGADGKFGDGDEDKLITGRKADVLMAAWTAATAAARTIKVGAVNTDVTTIMNSAVGEFNCSMVRGVLSHQMKQYVIDGNQVIISKESAEEKVDEFEFKVNEVYAVDVLVSTGDGRTKETDARTTIFKRDVDQSYQLKTQIGRKFFHEVASKHPYLPFSCNSFGDALMARAGVSECTRHSLIVPYPILTEKAGEYVAHFKFTVLMLPSGAKKVTGLPLAQHDSIKSEFSVKSEALAGVLSGASVRSRQKK